MTFEQALAWVTTVLSGMLASVIQEHLKDTPLGDINQKWLSVFLAVALGVVAYAVQFVFGFPLFSDIENAADILQFIAAFLAAWGGSQIWYGMRYAEKYKAPAR